MVFLAKIFALPRKVPPAELEAVLLTHPKVMDVAVIGKPGTVASVDRNIVLMHLCRFECRRTSDRLRGIETRTTSNSRRISTLHK